MADLPTQAAALKKRIQEDLIGSYTSLLSFAEDHSVPESKTKEQTILLGSRIFEALEERQLFSSDTAVPNLTREAQSLIDKIIDEAGQHPGKVMSSASEDIRKHFLFQKPKDDVVFQGENINKSFGKGGFRLKDISVTLRLGEITGVVGENGNGKTTLLRIIAGDLQCDGKITYPLISKNFLHWGRIKESIAFIRQNMRPLSSLHTLKQHLHFMAAIKGIRGKENESVVSHIINRLNLKKYEDCRWNELSGGFQMRFELARQLIWRPKLVILDEPLANLDVKAQAVLLSDLRSLVSSVNHSMALIISSQNLYDVEKISDQILFIKDGKTLFNGAVGDVGRNLNYKCFELDTDYSTLELQKVLSGISIRDIRQNGQYTLISTNLDVTSNRLLQSLIDAGVPIKFFRDISNSTRLLFEQ